MSAAAAPNQKRFFPAILAPIAPVNLLHHRVNRPGSSMAAIAL
jgi:hypothetical protein